MWVRELAVVMDLAREVGVVILRALEHDLLAISVVPRNRPSGGTFEPLLSLCDAK